MRVTSYPSPVSFLTPSLWPSPSQGAPRSLSLCMQPYPVAWVTVSPQGSGLAERTSCPHCSRLKSHSKGWTAMFAFREETEIVRNSKLFLKQPREFGFESCSVTSLCSYPVLPWHSSAQGTGMHPTHLPGTQKPLLPTATIWGGASPTLAENCHVTKATRWIPQSNRPWQGQSVEQIATA